MKKRILLIGGMVLLGATAAVNQLKSQTATLQVIHNCADAAAATVDIYAGPNLLINDLQFRFASQTFTNIPAGTNIVIGVAPATSTASSQSIATFTVNFAPNSHNIVVADGIVSGTGYTPSSMTRPFTLNSYTLGLSAAPNGTTTSLLVHHGSTDAPTVDVVAPFSGSVPVIPNALVNDAPYGAFAGYLNLPTANYNIQIRDQNSENVVAEYLAPLSTLNLGGTALSVIASGFLNPANNSNGPAFGLYVATAAGGSLLPLPSTTITSTRLQAIHNCADLAAASVDVYLKSAATGTGAIKIIDNFAFRTASPYIDVPTAQSVSVFIAAPSSTSEVGAIATFTYNLAAASKYQLIASGIVSASGYAPSSTTAPFNLTPYASARERSINSNNTDVLVYHGATDAPAVNVVAEGSGTVVSNMAYGTFNGAGYLQLPSNTSAGNYILHVTDVAGTTTVASFSAPLNTLGTSGLALSVVASGFLDPSVNSNGAAFGLWAALPTGGNLVQLPPVIITGIKNENLLSSSVKVYPNPFNSEVSLNNTSGSALTLSLIDINGKEIRNAIVTDQVFTMDTESLPSGVYFLKVNSNTNSAVYKLIK
ncbi:MAG: T9SS type A sorting domain-containing protein [Bacteroidia bacterium]|jgi:hypothetical protein|nr:T9SS type A sorting domain-containing protein [Bacteroidia bacterium]